MEETDYYQRAKRNHSEPKEEWVERVLAAPYLAEDDVKGRIRYYGYIEEEGKWLRVVVEDGKLFNRFFDRGKLREWGQPWD